MTADTLLSRLNGVLRIGVDQHVCHVADVPAIRDNSGTPFCRQRRQLLARLVQGAGWLVGVFVALMMLPAIAVVVLIGCLVVFARTSYGSDDGTRR